MKKKLFLERELPCGFKIDAERNSGDTVWRLSVYEEDLIGTPSERYDEVQVIGETKNIRAIKKFLDEIAANTPYQK